MIQAAILVLGSRSLGTTKQLYYAHGERDMANKKSNTKKPKFGGAKMSGKKSGASEQQFDVGSPEPVRKPKKKK